MHIVNLFKVVTSKTFETPNYQGSTLQLAEMFEAKKLGFHIEVINPKNFSAPFHYHDQEEELFLVLEGEAVVRTENSYRKVVVGDLFFYPTGSKYAHNLYNHTDKAFKFLGISNVSEEFDVCHYPDSNKKTSERGVLQNGEVVNYFKDEENPARYWSAEALRGEVSSAT